MSVGFKPVGSRPFSDLQCPASGHTGAAARTSRPPKAPSRRGQFLLTVLAGLMPLFTLLFSAGPAAAASARTTTLTRPSAEAITVSGSSLQNLVATSPSFSAPLNPAFSPEIYNYVLACPSGPSSVTFTMTAASGTIQVGGAVGATESATVSLTTDQAAVIQAPGSRGSGQRVRYWVRCLPPDFPPLKVVSDTDTAPPGFYLTQLSTITPVQTNQLVSGPYVMVLDNHGTPVWWQKTTPYTPAYFQMWQPNVLAWDSNGDGAVPVFDDNAGYTTYDLRTGTPQTVTPVNLPADPHDIIHLRDGNVMFLASPERTGVDLSAIGDGTDQNISDCVLQEVNQRRQVLWSWDALDHIGINESISPLKDTINGQTVWDIYHCNSVSLDQNDPNQEAADVVLSSREAASIYLINRRTGGIIWKVGGVSPTTDDPDYGVEHLAIRNDPETSFYAQHDATLSATGELTLFDDHSPVPTFVDPNEVPGAARGVEYQINAAAGTATLDWSLVAPDNESSLATGSFNRYDDGTDNIADWGVNNSSVIGDTTVSKLFTEVDQHGNVMLAVDFVEPTGSAFPNINDSYRTIKVPPSELSLRLMRDDLGGLPASSR
jgi:hypothetical protein